MREQQRSLYAVLFLPLFLLCLFLVSCSSGEEQEQEQELVAPLEQLKNDTALIDSDETELLMEINNFIQVSEDAYFQIVALDINNTSNLDDINTDLLLDAFSKLMVKLSDFQGENEERIRKDAENVLDEMNTTLYKKIEELTEEKERLDEGQWEIKREYANLSMVLSVLENYTLVLEERRELEERLNTSQVVLQEDTTIGFLLALVIGAVFGSLFCFKLRKSQKFLELFTRTKEKRPLLVALVASVILAACAFYIGFTFDVFWFL